MNAIFDVLCAALAERPVAWSELPTNAWAALPTVAQAEGVAALLVHQWRNQGWPEQMPSIVRQAFERAYYTTTAQSLLLYQALPHVLRVLQPVAPVVLLKGAALGTTLYPHCLLRPLSDLDLLVPNHLFQEALQALYASGYVSSTTPEIAPGVNQMLSHHALLHAASAGGAAIELHWSMIADTADWRAPDLAWIWQQIEPWDSQAAPSSIPPASTAWQLMPTAHLLYLSAHLMLQHGGAQARLIWLYDLHLVLTQNADHVDWDEVVARAHAWRWSAAVHAALEATQRCFDTPLPDTVLAALRVADRRAARFVERRTAMRATTMLMLWPKLLALPVHARARLVWHMLCPHPAYLRWRYAAQPTHVLPVYYLRHWQRLLREGAKIMLRFLRRRPVIPS